MSRSIIGATSAFDVFKLKNSLLANDAGEWGQEPGNDAVGVIRSTNFSNEGYLFLDDIAYRTLSSSKKKEKLINADDILIERSGGSNTQPVGRVGFIDKIIAEKELAFANFIQRICVDREIFYPKFAYYCLQQMYEMGITSSMQCQTTGIRNLDYKYYQKSNLPKPELSEQKAIAGILSKVDEAIEVVDKSIKAIERLKKSLMQNLLTGKLKPNGSWRSEDEFYMDDKFGKVPKGWEVLRLKDICKHAGEYGANTSAIDYQDDLPRFIRITDIDDYGNLIEDGKASIGKNKAENYILQNNDFLFAITGDTVGKSLLYKDDMGHAAFAGYLIKFTFKIELIVPEYFNFVAKSNFFEAFKVAMKRVGAKPNINSREYGSFKFLVPKDTIIQQEIVETFSSVELTVKNANYKIQSLKTLKKSLMQNLLTGKVRVDVKKINKLLEEG